MAILYVMADSVEKAMKVKLAAGQNVSELKRQLDEIDGREVTAAMEQYKITVKYIPLDVKQHDLLTRIIVNGEYTPADQTALRELIRQRQAI